MYFGFGGGGGADFIFMGARIQVRKWPFQAPAKFKGKMANLKQTNTEKQGKNAKRTNGTHFARVPLGGGVSVGCPRGTVEKGHLRAMGYERERA